jgi:hypothetical protein
MGILGDELLTAFKENKFLEIVFEKSRGGEEKRNALDEELIKLHNEGLVNIIVAFKGLKNKVDVKADFFLTRHVLENVLQRLNEPVLSVMECVVDLISEAGQDLAAGMLLPPYTDFCATNHNRPKEAINLIEKDIDKLIDLLPPTILAGMRINPEYYFNEILRFARHENIKVKRRSVFTLGRVEYPANSDLPNRAIACLESLVKDGNDDELLGNLVISSFNIYKQDNLQMERVIKIIELSLSKGDDFVLHSASKLFGFNCKDLPERLLDLLLFRLLDVRPKNKGTIDNIDMGLVSLLKKDVAKAINFLEGFLLKHPDNFSLDVYDSAIRELYNNKDNVLNILVTRWFLKGNMVLCIGITNIVNLDPEHSLQLVVERSELKLVDSTHLLFLARKAIGYLFSKPLTAVSFILSLIQYVTDDETINSLADLLFDSLLINYPGQIKDYLSSKLENSPEAMKKTISLSLKHFDNYLSDLKSIEKIPELNPTAAQREAFRRYFSRLMNKSMKDAEKKSVLLSFVSKAILLYGRKSINYVYAHNGESNRMEIPLKNFSKTMELPRIDRIDHFGLDYMLRIFRAERLKI